MINAQNCLHCKTCDIKDPTQNIDWTVPEVPVACGGLLLRSLRFAFARSTHIIVNLTPQNLIIVILSATSAAAHASSLSALTRLSGWRRPCLFRNVITAFQFQAARCYQRSIPSKLHKSLKSCSVHINFQF